MMTNVVKISVTPNEKSVVDFLVDSLSSLPNTLIVETDSCPVCGEEIYREGHCSICLGCGYSKCNL